MRTLPAGLEPGRLIVIGGGCYGSYHARQLARARDRGRIPFQQIIIVDRRAACAAREEFGGRAGFHFVVADWDDFLDRELAALPGETPDLIVPSPLSPHLMYHWLKRRAEAFRADGTGGAPRLRTLAFDPLPPTPFADSGPDGSAVLSFATWTCPATCYEPATCPKTRGAKAWEMDDAVFAWARSRRAAGLPIDLVEVFRCRHYAWGIAAYPARLAVRAGERLERLLTATRPGSATRRLLVATVSSCHGIMNGLEIQPPG